jgi:hypothetical protein
MNIQVVNFPNLLSGSYWAGWAFTMQESGVAIDLSGVDITCEFRKGSEGGTLTQTYTIGTGLTLLSAANGQFKIDEQASCDLTVADFYYYRIKFDFTDTGIQTLIQGQFKIE